MANLDLENLRYKELNVFSTYNTTCSKYRIEDAFYNGEGDKIIFKCTEYDRMNGTYSSKIAIYIYSTKDVEEMIKPYSYAVIPKTSANGIGYYERAYIY